MELSDKEILVLGFIKGKGQVNVVEIESELSSNAVGSLGKLLKLDKIEKIKIKIGEGYNMKSVVYYRLKEGEPKC